jgi:hypothetical protein
MSLIQGCLSRTATTAADLTSARAVQAPRSSADEIVVTTTEDRLTDKLVRLTIAAKGALAVWHDSEAHAGEMTEAMHDLAATLKEIGA